MSRPTPCPVPCTKKSAHPAAAITCRQAPSTSAAGTPARTAATPAAWLSTTTSTARRRSGSLTASSQTVRVMSEQYPSKRAPKSITTGSAGRMTPRPGAVVGHGRVGTAGHDGLERRAAGAQPPHLEVQGAGEGFLGEALRQLRADRSRASSAIRAAAAKRASSPRPLPGEDPRRGRQLTPVRRPGTSRLPGIAVAPS